MKYVISRYNHDYSWISDYSDDVVMYDRSDRVPHAPGSISVPNIGSDWYDKFTFIIDNYDNLPDVALYSKANLFKYITKEEFDKLKDNKTFTPLLTQNHKTYMPVCWYENGLYCERNDYWYLGSHPAKYANEVVEMLGMKDKTYNTFAPGSGYIVPKETILKKPKEFYERLRDYLSWTVYPGEAQIIERGIYGIWS